MLRQTHSEELIHAKWMARAVSVAQRNAAAPFGAILVDAERQVIVAEGVNHTADGPIWHGEIDAIARYAKFGGDRWHDLTLYTTAEPCCMCQGAILWAGVPRVVYGTSIETLKSLGWRQIDLRAAEVAAAGWRECEALGGILEEECDRLFRVASHH